MQREAWSMCEAEECCCVLMGSGGLWLGKGVRQSRGAPSIVCRLLDGVSPQLLGWQVLPVLANDTWNSGTGS